MAATFIGAVLFVGATTPTPATPVRIDNWNTSHAVAAAPASSAQTTEKKDSWNFFRGDRFDGISDSTGVADSWDAKGPPILWTIDLGVGYSGFVGAGNRVYTQYQSLMGQFVVCLDAKSGEKVWEHRYAWPYKPASLYPGPRSTPTISGDRIYYTTPAGAVGCLELETGKPVWEFSTSERFGSPAVEFGYACSPVIFDGKILLPAGGKSASMVALDPVDGKTIWQSGDHTISYCSAYPIQFEGQKLVVGYFKNDICLFDFETGEELGKYDISEDYDEHSAWPIYREPHLWVSGPFRAGCALFQLKRDKARISLKPIYKKEAMSNDVASCVLVGDSLFGFDIRDVQSKVHRPSRGRFSCMDFLTGEVQWQNGSLGRRTVDGLGQDGETISSTNQSLATDIGHASVIVAGDKLLMLNDTGQLIVGRAESARYREIGRWDVLGGEIIWTAPTLLNRCVFARNHSRAVCVYVGEVSELAKVDQPGRSIEFAAEVSQPKFLNLAPIVLGTEPKFAMTAPQADWLLEWFVLSILLGWVAAPIAAVIASKCFRGLSARWLFLLFAFVFGVLGTTVAGRVQGIFFFSWPIALAIIFECLVCQMKSRDESFKPNPYLARATLFVFLLACFSYFWLCRRLSLTFEWSFLMGFPASLPFLWVAKQSVQRKEAFSLWQWLFSVAGFSAFYWVGAGMIIWLYGS